MLKIKFTPVQIFGVVSALFLFAVPYEYCMDGMGYGFPFAWFHPGHGEWGGYVINPDKKFSNVIDFENIAASIVLWGILYGFVSWYLRRRMINDNYNSVSATVIIPDPFP